MKSHFLLSLALAQFVQFAYSSPLGPPGAEDPGNPYAVPYHTTQGFIKRHLKNMYNYFFNKEDSVHQDGHTKVYVMGKHMYYTYTHEYTPDNRYEHPFDRENRANVDNNVDVLKKYLKDEELIKKRDEELEFHKQNKKKLEEESIRQMKEGWSPSSEPIPPELQVNSKSGEHPPNQEEEESKEGGIFNKMLRKVQHSLFKQAIPNLLKRFKRDLSASEDTSPTNGIKDKLKAQLKNVIVKVMGKPHSKITDNVKQEIKAVASKVPGVIGTAATHVKDAIETVIGTVAGKVVDGVKSAVVAVGTSVIPTTVQKMPWKEYKSKLMKYVRKVHLLDIMIPNPDDPKHSYNEWLQMMEKWHGKKKQ